MDYTLLLAVFAGIFILLFLILKVRIQAFIALLISSITVGLIAGMEPSAIISTIQTGMGSTLGFVAVVVGLGAMFGAILEYSGGAEVLAKDLLKRFGDKHSSWALIFTGFLVAIPVFFDVAFIILVPIVYALQRKTGKSLLYYALPLLAGLGVTHVFIPPTPGPIAVAEILNADLGWVIIFGFIIGIPSAAIGGTFVSRYIADRIHSEAPEIDETVKKHSELPSTLLILGVIGLPIALIVANTIVNSPFMEGISFPQSLRYLIQLTGHPFTALVIANLVTWYLLGIRRGFSREKLLQITSRSMQPAGVIILLTGAGGVFKQMLVDTGSGKMIASVLSDSGISILAFAFIVAALVRVLQGSATVAMITAAGVLAPVLDPSASEAHKALTVIAIASGSTIISHVNDSGFWLVSKYLRLSEVEMFRSWTIVSTILGVSGFLITCIISWFIS